MAHAVIGGMVTPLHRADAGSWVVYSYLEGVAAWWRGRKTKDAPGMSACGISKAWTDAKDAGEARPRGECGAAGLVLSCQVPADCKRAFSWWVFLLPFLPALEIGERWLAPLWESAGCVFTHSACRCLQPAASVTCLNTSLIRPLKRSTMPVWFVGGAADRRCSMPSSPTADIKVGIRFPRFCW